LKVQAGSIKKIEAATAGISNLRAARVNGNAREWCNTVDLCGKADRFIENFKCQRKPKGISIAAHFF
jgi:hypothetical protein